MSGVTNCKYKLLRNITLLDFKMWHAQERFLASVFFQYLTRHFWYVSSQTIDLSTDYAALLWPPRTWAEKQQGESEREEMLEFCQILQRHSSLVTAVTFPLRRSGIPTLHGAVHSVPSSPAPLPPLLPANVQTDWNLAMNNWDEWQWRLIRASHNMP